MIRITGTSTPARDRHDDGVIARSGPDHAPDRQVEFGTIESYQTSKQTMILTD